MLINPISNFYNVNLINKNNLQKPLTNQKDNKMSSFVSFGKQKETVSTANFYNGQIKSVLEHNDKGEETKKYVSGFHSDVKQVKLPSYIALEVKEYEVEMVNVARKDVLNSWFSELEKIANGSTKSELAETFLENPDLRLFILSSLTTSLQSSNRMIPPPFNKQALETTIKNCFDGKNQSQITQHKFISEYNNTLVEQTIDNILTNPIFEDSLLYEKDGKPIYKKSIHSAKELSSVWVRIPSKKGSLPSSHNISTVENLSNPNWCTRSKHNKAINVLFDGPFYIYLERNANAKWDSKAAITTFNGKISQIQGKKNDNFIPMQMRATVSKFLQEIGAISTTPQSFIPKNRRCEAGYDSELPYAYTQLLIGQKLAEVTHRVDGKRTTSLNTALKQKDNFATFKILFPNAEVKMLENGKLSIKSYKSTVHIDNKTTIVPVTLLGVNEDELLSGIEEVTTNLDLSDAKIRKFPPSLKRVEGKLTLTKEQYEEYKKLIDENYSYESILETNKKMKKLIIISGLKSKEK